MKLVRYDNIQEIPKTYKWQVPLYTATAVYDNGSEMVVYLDEYQIKYQAFVSKLRREVANPEEFIEMVDDLLSLQYIEGVQSCLESRND